MAPKHLLKRRYIMTRLTTFDLNKNPPYAVGFDSTSPGHKPICTKNKASSGYPPANILKMAISN